MTKSTQEILRQIPRVGDEKNLEEIYWDSGGMQWEELCVAVDWLKDAGLIYLTDDGSLTRIE